MTSEYHDLWQRQRELQLEAATVSGDLQLDDLLARLGEPVPVGSVALGLMVWRDLDITVVCPSLDVAAAIGAAAHFATHARVWQVQFRNDTGSFNTDPAYPDGLYIGLRYRTPDNHDWKVDIWFVDEPERQPDLAHLDSIPPRLTQDAREAILRIKGAWFDRREYGSIVSSHDIYTAVLEHGVSTVRQFDDWRKRSANPAASTEKSD